MTDDSNDSTTNLYHFSRSWIFFDVHSNLQNITFFCVHCSLLYTIVYYRGKELIEMRCLQVRQFQVKVLVLFCLLDETMAWQSTTIRFFPARPLFLSSSKIQEEEDAAPQQQKRKSTNPRRRIQKKNTNAPKKNAWQTWRVFDVKVHPDRLVENGTTSPEATLHSSILDALYARLHWTNDTVSKGSPPSIQLVRRSVDARKAEPRYVYVLDVTLPADATARWKPQPGRLELLSSHPTKERTLQSNATFALPNETLNTLSPSINTEKPRVIVVGAGPAGLLCALQLAQTGRVTPIVLERGQPVETRGQDIGALMHRRRLNPESNFAFGEGGAGTWSDGKLTTRIGRNSELVRQVLERLVYYGAPPNILTEGAPHLGTDNLVRLLRNMRADLRRLGGILYFGTKMTELLFDPESGIVKGVKFAKNCDTIERNIPATSKALGGGNIPDELDPRVFVDDDSGLIMGDAVVLATGHSARDVYEQLHRAGGVQLEAKGFAVGFRVEHPQKLINQIQYGSEWGPSVITGKRTTDTANMEYFSSLMDQVDLPKQHPGTLPVPSYRLATDKAFDGVRTRGVYSFCMCPGGQIVPASTNPEEVCVNGMSFSKRDSPWANSALVVTIDPDDDVLQPYRAEHGVLAGIAFQRDMERQASIMGGGNLVVPVQRLTDFLNDCPSTSAPPSSYRLGVQPAACHRIYPKPIVKALKEALEHFEKQMPGFICEEGLLHGVETRTSSPVRIVRDPDLLHAIGTMNLYPAGEGAGFAGGIVSAAVDGLVVANALLQALQIEHSEVKGLVKQERTNESAL